MKSTKILSLTLASAICSYGCFSIMASAPIGENSGITESLESEICLQGQSDVLERKSLKKVMDIVENLNGEYELMSDTPCGEGSFAMVYPLMGKDGKKYVVKISKFEDNTYKFMEEKRCTDRLLKEIFDDYSGEVKIPFIRKFGEEYVIEECYGNTSLLKCYCELSEEERKEVVEKIAQVILYLMEKGSTGKVKEYTSVYDNEKQKDILKNYFAKNRSELAERFEKRCIKDEIETWAFVDLHLDNILYDRETKELSIIDLDGIRKDCIYRNFLPTSISHQNGLYKFMDMLMDCVNKYKPNTISKEKFKLFYDAEDEAIADVCFYDT